MELLSPADMAERLGVSVEQVHRMVRSGELLAVRFSTGIKVVLDDADRARER